MKPPVFVAILVIAFLAGAGLVWLITVAGSEQLTTTVAPTQNNALPGDRDGDGIGDEFDFKPYDSFN